MPVPAPRPRASTAWTGAAFAVAVTAALPAAGAAPEAEDCREAIAALESEPRLQGLDEASPMSGTLLAPPAGPRGKVWTLFQAARVLEDSGRFALCVGVAEVARATIAELKAVAPEPAADR